MHPVHLGIGLPPIPTVLLGFLGQCTTTTVSEALKAALKHRFVGLARYVMHNPALHSCLSVCFVGYHQGCEDDQLRGANGRDGRVPEPMALTHSGVTIAGRLRNLRCDSTRSSRGWMPIHTAPKARA
jgi:hypothetical protein